MAGKSDAKSPHDAYVLMHGPGTVRAGKWKFYPWAERKTGRGVPKGRKPSPEPVQLYDINSDIGETKNLAAECPDVVKKLKAVYQDHVNEIKANRRPTAKLQRPKGKPSAARP